MFLVKHIQHDYFIYNPLTHITKITPKKNRPKAGFLPLEKPNAPPTHAIAIKTHL